MTGGFAPGRILLLAIAFACAPVARAASTPRNPRDAFFSRIEKLIRMKVLRPKAVAKALGVTLARENGSPDEVPTFVAAASTKAAVGRVEIRAWPDPKDDGLVIVDAPRSLMIDQADVAGRFGPGTSGFYKPSPPPVTPGLIEPVSGGGPPGNYFDSYRRNGRKIEFLYSEGKPHRLESVVIDSSEGR